LFSFVLGQVRHRAVKMLDHERKKSGSRMSPRKIFIPPVDLAFKPEHRINITSIKKNEVTDRQAARKRKAESKKILKAEAKLCFVMMEESLDSAKLAQSGGGYQTKGKKNVCNHNKPKVGKH